MAAKNGAAAEPREPVRARHETVRLQYILWKDKFRFEKPYEVISQTPEGLSTSNFLYGFGSAENICDIRGQEAKFNLDDHAFEILQHNLTISSFDKETIEQEYLKSIKTLLQTIDPGAEVYIFDWRLRSSDAKRSEFMAGTVVDLDDLEVYLQPSNAVHVDQSRYAAIKRAHHHLGSRAEELLKRRFRVINVWRPLLNPVENYPLAVCDGSSVPEDKLLAVDHVRKHYVGEGLYPLADPQYRWYYLNQQTKDEVILIKTFDSKEGVAAKCCPHTSFAQSGVPANAKPRESIEVRALVFSQE